MRDLDRLERLAGATPDFIFWVDRRGVVVDANAAADRLADMVGLVPDVALKVAERRGVWRGELEVLTRDGRMMDTSAVVLVDDDATFAVVLRDISDLKQREEILRKMAERDPLTGLRNRGVLLSHLELAVAGAARGRTAALLYIDLDQLKQVNDAGGHGAGDRALNAFSVALEAAVRAEDLVCRMGGDEFAVLMPNIPATDGVAVAEAVFSRLGELPVSASVGVAVIDGSVTPADVIANADLACYAAKAAGGNRVAGPPSP